MDENENIVVRFANAVYNVLDTPVTLFRKTVIEPNQQKYPYYHQKFRRVPTIDECKVGDVICFHEANFQFHRDKLVDDQILTILRSRYEECAELQPEDQSVCDALYETYKNASGAWFAKYGDLGAEPNVVNAFMKQKHRMIWERRHGPVGSGMNEKFVPV